jgi:hypothetical protein
MVVQGAAASFQQFIAKSMVLSSSVFHVHRHHNLLSASTRMMMFPAAYSQVPDDRGMQHPPPSMGIDLQSKSG